MKKLYSFITLMAAALHMTLAAAPGYDVTIKVDDPSRVKVEFCEYSTPKQEVDFGGAGEITLEWPYNLKLRVTATEGNVLSSVNVAGEEQFIKNLLESTVTFDRSAYSDATVEISSRALSRTVGFTVNVDKPEKLIMFNDNTLARPNLIEFTEQHNEIRVDPDVELPVKFNGNRWNDNILKVCLNGDDITNLQDSYYELTPQDGDVYDFYFEMPQEQTFAVAFAYSEKAAGIVTAVKVDDVDMPGFDPSGFDVKAGAKLKIYIDTENYDIERITRDGEPVRWTNQEIYVDAVRSDLNFMFEAHKLGKATVNVDVDHAEGVRIFASSYPGGEPLPLTDGANAIELDELVNRYLCIVSHPDHRLVSVDINGAPMDREYVNYYKFADGDNIVVRTEALVRDLQAVIYVDKPLNVYMLRANESKLELAQGYNIVPISLYDSPFDVYHPAYATVNGVQIFSESEDDYIYTVELDGGDVLKMYVDGIPAMCNVEIVSDPADAARFAVMRDVLSVVGPQPMRMEAGSRVCIVPAEGEKLIVKANGKDVAAGTEMEVYGHHVVVADDTRIEIAAESSGLTSIFDKADGRRGGVFRIDGVQLGDSDRANLPAGVYIIGGKKLIVK